LLVAGDLIYAMDDHGTLTLLEATPKAYSPLAQAVVIEDGHESWAPLALAGGRLLARDLTRLVCLEVGE
jgi:outer membrane protein assembly factor BamB